MQQKNEDLEHEVVGDILLCVIVLVFKVIFAQSN